MSPAEPVRVMIVDDHAVVRSGLRLLLDREDDIDCVAEASSVEEALPRLDRARPDVILLDLQMPGLGGLAGMPSLRERAPDARVLVLSMHDDAEDVRRSFQEGAAGYVVKTAADEDVVRAVRVVASGERYVHPAVGAVLAQPASSRGPVDDLSPRERQVLRLLALGHTNQEIAEQLVVSVRTVESHRAHIMGKLRADSRAEMVRHAIDAGLLDPSA